MGALRKSRFRRPTGFKKRNRKFSEINKEWINSVPKTINDNGCWIPYLVPTPDGYVTISIESSPCRLHRLTVCVYYDLDYYDKSFESRHSQGCDRACFNPEHLQPGTISDNARDTVAHGNHHESKRELCDFGHPLDGLQRNRDSYSRYCKTCKRLRELR